MTAFSVNPNEAYSERVWYVAYGSNMLRERLLAYLEGTTAARFGGEHFGAIDARRPSDDRLFRIRHNLFFAGHSKRWSGPVAFLECDTDALHPTLGRGYLLFWSQMEAIIGQENGVRTAKVGTLPEADKCADLGIPGKYNAILRLDDLDGSPAVTSTTTKPLVRKAPSDSYLNAMGQGLSEISGLTDADRQDYMLALRKPLL